MAARPADRAEVEIGCSLEGVAAGMVEANCARKSL
jgi:hypothetical protein